MKQEMSWLERRKLWEIQDKARADRIAALDEAIRQTSLINFLRKLVVAVVAAGMLTWSWDKLTGKTVALGCLVLLAIQITSNILTNALVTRRIEEIKKQFPIPEEP